MGNSLTKEEELSDQEIIHRTSYSEISSEPPENMKSGPEPPENMKNGPVTIEAVQISSTKGETVDARVNGVQDNVAVSSPETMEISSVSEAPGNNLGKEAKTALPAAKSRFAFAFSRPVPGRTEELATNASVASAPRDASSEAAPANKATSELVDLHATAAPEEASDKTLSEASLTEIELSEPASSKAEDAALPKPKELTFFDRLFKFERGKDKNQTQAQSQDPVKAENPSVSVTAEETSGLQSASDNARPGKDIECEETPVQEDSPSVVCLNSEDLAQEEVKPENVRTATGTDYNNSVMSFFKTLVSPSKADSKSDSEDKATQAGRTQGGQLAEKTAADSHAKGTKKKKTDSPRLGHSTFSKLFRHKSKKDAQQTANTKSTEQPLTTDSVKAEANTPPSQETPATKQSTKAPEPPVQQQAPPAPAVITNEIPKEVTKERSASTPTPLSKFFWKKTPTDDIEVINTERVEVSSEAPARDESRSLEASETRSKGEEKPSKTNLRKFFKLTLDFPDRPFAQAESRESAGARSKEGSTETLSKPKGSKQEVREQQEPQEQERSETDSLQNGGDAAKENTPKRTEKRQSFGGFFKGLSPKRMSDAEVQTDPVSFVTAPVKPKQ